MKKLIWNNCPITNQNSEILQSWSIGKKNHTGVDVQGSDVHSICDGVVIQLGQATNKTYAITVQYSTNQCVRYSNLSSVDVSAGQIVEKGQLLGQCKEFVHFEYLTTYIDSSQIFTVRIGTQTYYKHDPQCIIDGSILLSGSGLKNITIINDSDKVNIIHITGDMDKEFTGNRGDE